MDDRQVGLVELIEAAGIINERFSNVQRIDDIAGGGTFSFVFSADDVVTGKKVALKFHNTLNVDSYRLNCFHRESDILKKLLGQPDILQFITCGELEIQVSGPSGRSFSIPMPYIATERGIADVGVLIYTRDLSPMKKLIHFRTMCRAVQRIHNHKIAHRDLRPANFLLVKGGYVCLSDFGTAKILDGSMSQLIPEYLMAPGHKRYMAPEMFMGLTSDHSLYYFADVYSLGAILFEMFSRQTLFNYIFDITYVNEFASYFSQIPAANKKDIFLALVEDISNSRKLPNIYDFDSSVPPCIKGRLDSLYKGLASLDYRKRITDFTVVFEEINKCVDMIQHETSYTRLIELRRKWQENRRNHLEEIHNRLKQLL